MTRQYCFFCDTLGRWQRGPAYWIVRAHMRRAGRRKMSAPGGRVSP